MFAADRLVTGVDFVPIPTRNFDAAVEFYGSTLGLERSAHNPDRGFAEFETGNLTLSLIDSQKMGLQHSPNANAIALHVEDIEQARATLQARGVSFAADTLDTSVCHMAFFADPDGNALMLHHRYVPRVPEA
jgi:predicted enzyme related to lactoylglutathione lyase